MLIGTHCSISGGVENAILQAVDLGIDTFQIFTKNQRQWREKEFTEAEGKSFREKLQKAGVKMAFSHTTYLINLASADDEIREKSILGLAAELIRCDALGLKYTVLHPGANKYISEIEAIDRIADALNIVTQYTESLQAMVLLENTAGQGSSIGYKFEHHQEIIKRVNTDKIGVCVDTCHAYAAGCDIRTRSGVEALMEGIDKLIGLEKIKVFHFNDSKGDLGSRLDRHAHIGQGKLGLEPFRQIIRNFPHVPKVLETSKESDMDIKNLELLKEMV
jgi:deoxyribonuclease IV